MNLVVLEQEVVPAVGKLEYPCIKSTWKELNKVTGGLSSPSKMPCHSWSISARRCKVGSVLQKVEGSVCEGCYALKGMYVFSNVKKALERRYQCLIANPSLWGGAMVLSITKTKNPFFRWHDSGDLQGVWHLHTLVLIAEALPNVTFWLPTRELKMINQYNGTIPNNLIIRRSAAMVGGTVLSTNTKHTLHTSSVGSGIGVKCPASLQDNMCGDCRMCWDKDIPNIDYVLH